MRVRSGLWVKGVAEIVKAHSTDVTNPWLVIFQAVSEKLASKNKRVSGKGGSGD